LPAYPTWFEAFPHLNISEDVIAPFGGMAAIVTFIEKLPISDDILPMP